MKQLVRALSGLLLVASTLGCAQTHAKGPAPIVHCDVTNEDFCFALPSGATSMLSIPVDFKLYEVLLPNRQKILVYYGSQPDYPEQAPEFSEASGTEKISLFRQTLAGRERIDAFYEKEREKFTMVVHVQASSDEATKASVVEFLASMRKCASEQKGSIMCTSEPLFAKVAEQL